MQAVLSEDNLIGSFATTFKAIIADDDNMIYGDLSKSGSIVIQAKYAAGKVHTALFVRSIVSLACIPLLRDRLPAEPAVTFPHARSRPPRRRRRRLPLPIPIGIA